MSTPNLKPVYLDNVNISLMGDPKPAVSKVVAASGKKPDNFQVKLLQSEKDLQGSPLDPSFVLDRTVEPTKPIYLLSVANTTQTKPAPPGSGTGSATKPIAPGSPAPKPQDARSATLPTETSVLPATATKPGARAAATTTAVPTPASHGAQPASKQAPVLDVEKALKELATTSMAEIEHSTALTWGARAVASFQLCAKATDWPKRFQHFCDGENYRQEALEHAAMGTDWQQLMPIIDAEINASRTKAETAMQVAKPFQPTSST